MKTLPISQIISTKIAQYFHGAASGSRDSRLLVPGLTTRIAKEIHEHLLDQRIKCYLVIGESETPDEKKQWLRAIGLTSKRIGSFVVIVSPGQMAHVQDSVRGSGGTIRAEAFSEEWPWVDNGIEPCRFDGPVLTALVQTWGNIEADQKWLIGVGLGLRDGTRALSTRTHLFFEKMLAFNPRAYTEISDIKKKFLFHVGIPCPADEIDSFSDLIKKTSKLCGHIVERCREASDIREQVEAAIRRLGHHDEEGAIRAAANRFLDRFGQRTIQDTGLLAFHGCWPLDTQGAEDWLLLDTRLLQKLFDINEPEKTELKCHVECARAHVANEGRKKLLTFAEEEIIIRFEYKIPREIFDENQTTIRLWRSQRELFAQPVDYQEGTGEFRYKPEDADKKEKISLRLELGTRDKVRGNEKVLGVERLELQYCNKIRPALVVVEPGFLVIDVSTKSENGEGNDTKIDVDTPVNLYLFRYGTKKLSLSTENGTELPIDEVAPGIFQTRKELDAAAAPLGQIGLICNHGEDFTNIRLEAEDIARGEFTLEDELRVSIVGTGRKGFEELVRIFHGTSRQPYPWLGSIDGPSRARMHLANLQTETAEWRPFLVDLLSPIEKEKTSVNKYTCELGQVEPGLFSNLALPPEAELLLEAYAASRKNIITMIMQGLDGSRSNNDHPMYASHPTFVKTRSNEIEEGLCSYLTAFENIVGYTTDQQKFLGRPELLILQCLDCVVHWNSSPSQGGFFLVGPWHPLVIAKRYMVQAALFHRALRILEKGKAGHQFRHLTVLLAGTPGFRWFPTLSTQEKRIEAAYVMPTSDPGWHIALSEHNFKAGELAEIRTSLQTHLGLAIDAPYDSSKKLTGAALSSFQRAFPSRRSIGIQVRGRYDSSDVVTNVDEFLHSNGEATREGGQLPGGVRVFLENNLDESFDEKWSNSGGQWANPPLLVYRLGTENDSSPDIDLMPPPNAPTFRRGPENHNLPRGAGLGSVFSEPLRWVSEGSDFLPKSVSYEFDHATKDNTTIGLGDLFLTALGRIAKSIGQPITTVTTVDLTPKLLAPWVILAGRAIDPAVLVKYVHDGARRNIEERALWDYKVDLAGHSKSYYILSRIPRSFQIAVNGFFAQEDVANNFITELGKIGIAIGGEALKSGRHALGIVGLVGAVRLMLGYPDANLSPLKSTENTVSFLLPVDSFTSFFGQGEVGIGKRTDLLAIRITMVQNEGKIKFAACGVEAKFVSGTLTRPNEALEQGIATVRDFKDLLTLSLENGGMPERLAFLEMIRFGLRISNQANDRTPDQRLDDERKIFSAILNGNYSFEEPNTQAVVISTESSLVGAAEANRLSDGLWVRLTKGHWPGIYETTQIRRIREALCAVFVDEFSPIQANHISKSPQNPIIANDRSAITTLSDENLIDSGVVVSRGQQEERLQAIFIGTNESRKEVYFDPQSSKDPLDNINIMITGSSGKGKTQFLKYLVCKLREQAKNALIIDFKNDFASDETFCRSAGLDRVFTSFDGLPYNPLIPYPVQHPATGKLYIQCSQHIEGIVSVLARTFGLGAQQQVAVKNAIVRAFASAGLQVEGSTPYAPNCRFPDFSEVGALLKNENAAAYNRLDPLFTLDLFRPGSVDKSFEALVSRAVVLDLSQIPSEKIQNALAQLIVMTAHPYYNSQPHSGTIRQFLLFDEAHRVLTSEYMKRLVLECRAYGVGTILSSQYPTQFPSDISSSMAMKVIHGNGPDVERAKDIAKMIGLDAADERVKNMGRFEAFIDNRHHPHTFIRTMNYPAYVLWTSFKKSGKIALANLNGVDGLDADKLPIEYLIRNLEGLGLIEERDGYINLLKTP